MEISKALILAGRGTDDRPWPGAPSGPKQLFPVGNRPLLFHNLEGLRAAGVREVSILADASAAAAIEHAVGDGRDWGLRVRYAEWESSLAGALAVSDDFIAGEPVLVQQGGALLRGRMHRHFSTFARENLDALALRLVRSEPSSAFAETPGYVLNSRAVEIIRGASGTAKDPVAGVREQGGRVRVQRVDGCLPCHGDLETVLESNRRVLEKLDPSIDPTTLDQVNVQGAVHIDPTARVARSLLRGPVVIGPGARIVDAYIGPYTSIGDGVIVEGTEIEHSIVLPRAELRYLGTRLESSVIGHGARVTRGFEMPAALRMAIGDGAEVVLR
jgi:glucose-1-phosphate thymidylyltransferase